MLVLTATWKQGGELDIFLENLTRQRGLCGSVNSYTQLIHMDRRERGRNPAYIKTRGRVQNGPGRLLTAELKLHPTYQRIPTSVHGKTGDGRGTYLHGTPGMVLGCPRIITRDRSIVPHMLTHLTHIDRRERDGSPAEREIIQLIFYAARSGVVPEVVVSG